MKKTICLMISMLFCGVCFGAVTTESYLSPDGVTIQKLDSNRLVLTNAANSIDGGLLQNKSVTAGKLDANATPVNRWNESFNDFVFTGLVVPTSDDLDATTTSGIAYINGVRVVKDATLNTYTASVLTYLDLSDNGTYTYSEAAGGGAVPSVALNSIRLMIVSADATKVSFVSDERTTTVTLGTGSAVSLVDTDQDTQIQVEKNNDEDIIRFDIAGTETIVFGDGTNEELVKFTNAGTHHGLNITQNGALAANKNALHVISNTTQGNSPLVFFKQDGASSNQPTLTIENDGTGRGILLVQSGSGKALEIDNDGDDHGLFIHQDTVLAGSRHALFIISDVANISPDTALVKFTQDSASATVPALEIANDGTGRGILVTQNGNGKAVDIVNNGTDHGLLVQQDTVLAGSRHALSVTSNVANVNTDSALVKFTQDHASASEPVLEFKNDGSGVQIQGTGNENLSNAGVFTDRTSLFADKENIRPLDTAELVEQLKGMNLHRYQKKCEIYGNKKKDEIEISENEYDIKNSEHKKKGDKFYKEVGEKKYGSVRIRPNAKEYVGLMLDDPTTPEELISRDLDGNINGKSGTQIAEFLLGVCQELIKRIEILEAR